MEMFSTIWFLGVVLLMFSGTWSTMASWQRREHLCLKQSHLDLFEQQGREALNNKFKERAGAEVEQPGHLKHQADPSGMSPESAATWLRVPAWDVEQAGQQFSAW